MPIKGLTDRGLAFPEIGQIRKGARKDGKGPGKDLTYFRVDFDEREALAAETFQSIYGQQPSEIRVVLPFNEISHMWDAWMEAYTAGRMVARSDGEIYTYLVDTETGAVIVKNGVDVKTGVIHPYVEDEPCGWYRSGEGRMEAIFCKPAGRLKVIVRELARAAYLTVLTTSKHDIANISSQLRAFQTLNAGQIAGIPLILRRRPKKVSVPRDGNRVRMVKWLLSVEADPEWVKAALQHTTRLALPGAGLALPEPVGMLLDAAPDEAAEDDFQEDHDEGELETAPEPPAPPKVEVVPAEVAAAMKLTTKMGSVIGDLDDAKLAMVASQSTKDEMRRAANLVLAWRHGSIPKPA